MAKKPDKKTRGVFEKVPGSGVWWIIYYAHGKRHREKVGSKPDAIAAYQQRKTEIRQRKFDSHKVGRREITVDEVLERYKEHFANLRSPAQHIRHRKKWSEFMGDQLVRDIKPGDIRTYMRREAKRLAPATVNLEYAYLRKAFAMAVEDELIDRNPCIGVRRLKVNNGRLRWLDTDEEFRLSKHFRKKNFQIAELAIDTGLRKNELFRIKRAHVDWKRQWLSVPERKGGISSELPLTKRAFEILKERFAAHDSEWLLPSRNPNKPKDSRNWYVRVFRPAVKAAGLGDLVFHDLRHTFCTRLVMSGVSLVTVQRLAGHQTIEMTGRYSHLAPDFQRAEIAKLEGWGLQRPERLFPFFSELVDQLMGHTWVTFGPDPGGCLVAVELSEAGISCHHVFSSLEGTKKGEPFCERVLLGAVGPL